MLTSLVCTLKSNGNHHTIDLYSVMCLLHASLHVRTCDALVLCRAMLHVHCMGQPARRCCSEHLQFVTAGETG